MDIWRVIRGFKDEVAILLSMFALAVSVLSVYLQFRETDAVTIRLVDIDSTIDHSQKAAVQMVVSNAGNLPYLVSEIKMIVSSDPHGKGYAYPSDGSTSLDDAPFVLNKGEMKLIKMEVPVASIAGSANKPYPAYLGALVTSTDVYGEVHRVELWYAAFCVDSGMLINGISSINKFTLKSADRSMFSRSDANQCP